MSLQLRPLNMVKLTFGVAGLVVASLVATLLFVAKPLQEPQDIRQQAWVAPSQPKVFCNGVLEMEVEEFPSCPRLDNLPAPVTPNAVNNYNYRVRLRKLDDAAVISSFKYKLVSFFCTDPTHITCSDNVINNSWMYLDDGQRNMLNTSLSKAIMLEINRTKPGQYTQTYCGTFQSDFWAPEISYIKNGTTYTCALEYVPNTTVGAGGICQTGVACVPPNATPTQAPSASPMPSPTTGACNCTPWSDIVCGGGHICAPERMWRTRVCPKTGPNNTPCAQESGCFVDNRCTVTPSPTRQPTTIPSPTRRPSVIPSPTRRPSVIPSPTRHPSVSPSPTRRVTPSPTRRVTPSPTRRVTPSPTIRLDDVFFPFCALNQDIQVRLTDPSTNAVVNLNTIQEGKTYNYTYQFNIQNLVKQNNYFPPGGQYLDIKTTVANGTLDQVQNTRLHYPLISNHRDGGSTSVTGTFVAGRTNTFSVQLDPNLRITELNENNNNCSISLGYVTPTPTPGTGGLASCNQTCTYNSDCTQGLFCSTISGSERRCRRPENTSSVTCVLPPDSGIQRSCNEYCADTRECQTAYTCWYNRCRNPYNVSSTSCSAPTRTSQQAIATACNQSCTSNRDCANNMRCYNGVCRLALNPVSRSCSPPSPTIIASRQKGEEIAVEDEVSGTPSPSRRPSISASPSAKVSPLAQASIKPSITPVPDGKASLLDTLRASGALLPILIIAGGVGLLLIALLIALASRPKKALTQSEMTERLRERGVRPPGA